MAKTSNEFYKKLLEKRHILCYNKASFQFEEGGLLMAASTHRGIPKGVPGLSGPLPFFPSEETAGAVRPNDHLRLAVRRLLFFL